MSWPSKAPLGTCKLSSNRYCHELKLIHHRMSRPRSSLWGLWILSRDRYLAKYQDLVAQDKNAEDGDVEMEENDEEGEGEGEDGVDDADGDEVMAE